MAYNNYYPASYYQPTYTQPQMIPQQAIQPTVPQQQPQQNNSSIIWVQGEAAARSFNVMPNQSVMLLDSESSTFYIKSADASGMPLPLRIFDYTERNTNQNVEQPQIQKHTEDPEYITRDEFERRIAEITSSRRQMNARKDKE